MMDLETAPGPVCEAVKRLFQDGAEVEDRLRRGDPVEHFMVTKLLGDLDPDAAEEFSKDILRLVRWLTIDERRRLKFKELWAQFE
jgi:hypothetical protein